MPRVFMRSICILLHSSVPKCSILLAGGTGGWKVSSVARGFSSIKIDYSDYSKSLISRINEVYVFFNKTSL